MTVTDYKKIVDETAVFPTKVENFGLAYSMLGLIEETDEFLSELTYYSLHPYLDDSHMKVIKELGDVFWYLAAACRELDVSMEVIIHGIYMDTTYVPADGKLDSPLYRYMGQIKKHYRDGKVINKDLFIKVMTEHFYVLKTSYTSVTNKPFDLGLILQTNYDKLIKRKQENKIKGDGSDR